MKGNFVKMNSANWDSFGEAYDFDSIMHYDGYSFTKNGKPTIVDKVGLQINDLSVCQCRLA